HHTPPAAPRQGGHPWGGPFVSVLFPTTQSRTLPRRIRSGCCARAARGQTAALPIRDMNSRRLNFHLARGSRPDIVSVRTSDVRFGSKADICGATRHVRFTPNSDRESEIPQKAMSALPPKADLCSALAHVCFGPIADIA